MRYHITWSTYGTWLPGDPRGFRTRHHRMHVDGDYRNPPPPGKYDGLHAAAEASLHKPPVMLPPQLRPLIGQACLDQFHKESAAVHVLSIGGQHAHVAVETAEPEPKQLVGRAKKVSSHRVRQWIPGRVWAAGCHVVPVQSDEHWNNVLRYIRGHAPGAWVWVRPS